MTDAIRAGACIRFVRVGVLAVTGVMSIWAIEPLADGARQCALTAIAPPLDEIPLQNESFCAKTDDSAPKRTILRRDGSFFSFYRAAEGPCRTTESASRPSGWFCAGAEGFCASAERSVGAAGGFVSFAEPFCRSSGRFCRSSEWLGRPSERFCRPTGWCCASAESLCSPNGRPVRPSEPFCGGAERACASPADPRRTAGSQTRVTPCGRRAAGWPAGLNPSSRRHP
jgi:hypothetical protein